MASDVDKISLAIRQPSSALEEQQLPASIAFLTDYAFSAPLLWAACQRAETQGVHIVDLLFAEGWVEEDFYYEALARHCHVAFIDTPVELAGSAHYLQAIFAGIAELAQPGRFRWIVAPRGKAICAFIKRAQQKSTEDQSFALTTTTKLREWVFAHARREVAYQASFALPSQSPELSAFRTARSKVLDLQIMALWLLAPLIAWVWPQFVFEIMVVLCGIGLAGAIWVRLSAAIAPRLSYKPVFLSDHDLPTYSLIIPIYREANVVPALLQAIDNLDYPKAKLQILIVMEEGDFATHQAVKGLKLPSRFEAIIAPKGAPKTKPRALNIALSLARGEFCAVYDAEDQPHPQQLRRAAEVFAGAPTKLACLQAPLVIDNASDNWLTALFAIEYAALFDVIDPGLAFLGFVVPLGGTSNHFRLKVLRAVGGWDAWNVTEDADLGIRLARLGYSVGMIDLPTYEEAPISIKAWIQQRQRWQKGWLQTLVVHCKYFWHLPSEIGWRPALAVMAMLAGMVQGPVLGPILAVITLAKIIHGTLLEPYELGELLFSTFGCFVFLIGALSLALPILLGLYRRNLWSLSLNLLGLPVYYLLMMYASWAALFELFISPFRWNKTVHGRARRRRPV